MNWESAEVSGLGQERFWSQEGQYKRHQRGRTTCKTEDGGAWVTLRSLSRAGRKFGSSSVQSLVLRPTMCGTVRKEVRNPH